MMFSRTNSVGGTIPKAKTILEILKQLGNKGGDFVMQTAANSCAKYIYTQIKCIL